MDGGRMQNGTDIGLMGEKKILEEREEVDLGLSDPTTRDEAISESTKSSCPFQPGFGPCWNGYHVHNTINVDQRQHEGFGELEGNF
ncbi:hypothetical protein PIB30_079343 [Stylosanthes scabra]|uniref:Uncharacterized protein n=1 Tax=Stylosanthes scabra TaxID=79078 RepID=A0ABU6RRB2_9FABA|nr:hypothetical protein [Stylosanthes scabra]